MTVHGDLLVVIDPQRAFVDPAGSLALAYGLDEVRPSIEALERLQSYLRALAADPASVSQTVFVRSEYRPGQFTGGRLHHVLADLCVPGRNVDCEWAAGLDPNYAGTIITKTEADAGSADAYRDLIARAVRDGVGQIVLAGFQLTTCVLASALTTVRLVAGSRTRVVVAESFAGARASSHVRTPTGSRVELARRQMRAAGVLVTD